MLHRADSREMTLNLDGGIKALGICRVKKSLSEGALRPSDLLAQFKQIGTTTRRQIRAAELLDNTVELIREMVYTNTMIQPNPYSK